MDNNPLNPIKGKIEYEKELQKILPLVERFLDVTKKLVDGPNRYKSACFSRVLEGTFRRDYLTLYTITFLAKQHSELQVITGNNCMDLSRRVFEDLVGLEYMLLHDKEKVAKKFMDFKAIEAMRDINYLKEAGYTIDPDLEASIIKDFDSVKNRFKDKKSKDGVRRAWAGLDTESMILMLLQKQIIQPDEARTLLQTYQAGCYKNHFSPSDIFSFLYTDLFDITNSGDLVLSLITTLSSVAKMAIRFTEEFDVDPETSKSIHEIWETLLRAHKDW